MGSKFIIDYIIERRAGIDAIASVSRRPGVPRHFGINVDLSVPTPRQVPPSGVDEKSCAALREDIPT